MALTQVNPGLLDSNAQYTGFKNRIINGAMGIWQRGTSFIDQGLAYTADRWLTNRGSNVTGITVTRSTSVPTGLFQYSLCLQRTAGNATTNTMNIYNSNETVNTYDLAGQSVTISFWVKAGANFSGSTINVLANWGTGTDERIYAYTGSTSFINTNQAITTTWTRYTFTGSVGATSTEVGFIISYTPSGTAGADDAIYVTGVQLEKGSTATSFDYRPYTTELALCQRYFVGITNAGFAGVGFNESTTKTNPYISLPVLMRSAPTLTAPTTYQVNYAAASTPGTVISSNIGAAGGLLSVTTAAVLTTGQCAGFTVLTGTLGLSSEL